MQLHPFQLDLDAAIDDAQARGARNVLAQLPTGGGKTVVMAHRFNKHVGAAIGIAHRQELLGQMSLKLAAFGLRHRVIGGDSLIRQIVAAHMQEYGRSFYDPHGRVGVAGVDTLARRLETVDGVTRPKHDSDPWFRQVTLWQQDECHHVLAANKWGNASLLFPNALGIGWTATPGRADGYGLGRHADGVMDAMVSGPSMRWLIDSGYLTDYRVFCPKTDDLKLDDVPVTASGDYSPDKLRKAVHLSHIVGDVVKHYLRIAPGKLGLTFAVDVEHATEIAAAYRAAGVKAEVVTGETPDVARTAIFRRFRNREIQQIVSVDIIGEGLDVPALEVVSFARPTASYVLYAQQFGRVLRIMEGKPYGIVIDHVGNVLKHGLPDRPKSWTLNRRERRSAHDGTPGDIPVRPCPNCTMAYERLFKACPYCGWVPEPAGRGSPDQVDGDLIELDPAVLAVMRADIAAVDAMYGPGYGGAVGTVINRNHLHRQQAQAPLRAAIALWAGWRRVQGENDSQVHRRFFFEFGTDILSAQVLGASDATALCGIIQGVLSGAGVVAA